jgi:2-aminobenzoate-CoA ligase
MPVPVEEGLPPRHLWPERVYTLPESRYPVRLNVARELLDAHAEGGRAGRVAIYAGDQVITYGELQRRVNRLAHGLRGTGIDQGSRVLLRLPNCPEFIITWLALQKVGAIPVSTMPLLRARELAYIIDDAGSWIGRGPARPSSGGSSWSARRGRETPPGRASSTGSRSASPPWTPGPRTSP